MICPNRQERTVDELKGIKDRINNHKKQTIAVAIVLAIILCAGIAVAVTLRIKEKSVILASKAIIAVDMDTARKLADTGAAVYNDRETTGGSDTDSSDTENTSSAPATNDDQNKEATSSPETAAASDEAGHATNPETPTSSENTAGSPGNGTSRPDDVTNEPTSDIDVEETAHVHTWVNVSPENSWHMEYAAECRVHGYNGEDPMFFQSLEDLFLHQAADGCMSSWGTGFKGLAYKYCSGCGEEVITGHVHDFGTIAKEITFEEVICECGQTFTGGKDYTALESWNTHVDIYTSNGYPLGDHDSYQLGTDSVTRYEATKTCTCGWRPVDNRPVY